MKLIWWQFLVLFILGCTGQNALSPAQSEPDVLNYHFGEKNSVPFSDLGNWQGYMLPSSDYVDQAGVFYGPFNFESHGRMILKKIYLQLKGQTKGKIRKADFHSLPGMLIQHYELNGITVVHKLFFINARTAAVYSSFRNDSETKKLVSPRIRLTLSEDVEKSIDNNMVRISINGQRGVPIQIMSPAASFNTIDDIVTEIINQSVELAPGDSLSSGLTISAFYKSSEENALIKSSYKFFKNKELHIRKNRKRWQQYLRAVSIPNVPQIEKTALNVVAVKSVQTLIDNWRAPWKNLKHDGVFPSSAVRYFNGYWAWDSWKHAAALAHIAPDLAKKQILAMLDYQNEAGMVPDCIYADSSQNNWRNTKPPLAGWSVWRVFNATRDSVFLRRVFPSLLKYHDWWYKNRDVDGNGWCEYGSTDGTRVAAAWESGMDNAVRFDSTRMLRSGEHAFSINLESVDLNAFLISEKFYLSKLAHILGLQTTADSLYRSGDKLKNEFNSYFYNKKLGWYTDYDMDAHQLINVPGPEGWIPLWAGIVFSQGAEQVKIHILDTSRFNTYVPFPTISKKVSQFDPIAYWRGPVWVDQVYFALRGLHNYGYSQVAQPLFSKFIKHAEGITRKGIPLHENYNPLTGERLNAPHFSWTAAHLLLIYEDLEGQKSNFKN